jgi:acetylornithine deacetylase/succinyl-diaminopimelate desuccinylase-like protein
MPHTPFLAPRPGRATLALALLVLGACTLPAQRTRGALVPVADKRVRSALELLRSDNEWTLQQQISICEIPAPPFTEAARAAEYRRRLEALGLTNVRIDAEGNVIAERPGSGGGPTVLISAHLDTVFPEGTDVRVRREGSLLRGPGIGDDCRGLAVLLAVARALGEAGVRTRGPVYFVGTVGEEGEGNLRGVRHLFASELKDRVDYFISVDGSGSGITSRAVGSRRYRVTYRGPGGHSYSAFGMPNPIHALGRAVAAIGDVRVPAQPKTTFNVGVVEGGTSVNSIAASGSMVVDLRSESPASLDSLDARFRAAVEGALAAENARWPDSRHRLTMDLQDLGHRPAGGQPDSARIVQVALAAARAAGLGASTGASSTDANLPMSLGIPAITIDGGGTGQGSHSLGEWYDDGEDGWRGAQWAALLVLGLAGVR